MNDEKHLKRWKGKSPEKENREWDWLQKGMLPKLNDAEYHNLNIHTFSLYCVYCSTWMVWWHFKDCQFYLKPATFMVYSPLLQQHCDCTHLRKQVVIHEIICQIKLVSVSSLKMLHSFYHNQSSLYDEEKVTVKSRGEG